MGKTKKAPDYATASYDTAGLFGSSTTGKSGTKYNAPNWISNTMGTVGNNVNTTLGNMLTNDYTKDANFQAYQNQLNKTMAQNYDTSVLSQLANRGLMRSSALDTATNNFANTLADNTMNLYDNYYNRQQNNLSNLLNTSNTLYNYITGVNQGSQADANNISNYNLQKYQAELQAKAANQAMWGQLAGAAAGLAGAGLTGGMSLAGNKMLAGALASNKGSL